MTGEDWVFDTVPDPTLTTNSINFSAHESPNWLIVFPSNNPNKVIFHFNGQEVGQIDLSSGVLKFEGAVDESAAALFLALKARVDKYIDDNILE